MEIQVGKITKTRGRDDEGDKGWVTVAKSAEELCEFLNDADSNGVEIRPHEFFKDDSFGGYWFRIKD